MRRPTNWSGESLTVVINLAHLDNTDGRKPAGGFKTPASALRDSAFIGELSQHWRQFLAGSALAAKGAGDIALIDAAALLFDVTEKLLLFG